MLGPDLILFLLFMLYPSVYPQNPGQQDGDMYRSLSPGAFFDMKDNADEPVGLGDLPKIGMAMMAKGKGAAASPAPGVVPLGPTGNGLQGYEHFDMQTLNMMSRQQKELQENYALLATIEDDQKKTNEFIIYNLCFCMSYIWRRGRQSIRKYFYLRDIYANHLPYEVGYMTHIIMIKYQNMLELYQYASNLVGNGKSPKINSMQMTHFHKSIAQDSRTIVHLCNMMHELKNKYDSRPYDPGNRFDNPANYSAIMAALAEESDADGGRLRLRASQELGPQRPDKAYLKKRMEQSHKIIDEALAKRKKKLKEGREFYNQHGYTPSTTRTQQPMRLWSPKLDYGWSGEDW